MLKYININMFYTWNNLLRFIKHANQLKMYRMFKCTSKSKERDREIDYML